MNHQRAGHLVLSDWAPNEDHNSLPLILILSVFQGKLCYLHCAG